MMRLNIAEDATCALGGTRLESHGQGPCPACQLGGRTKSLALLMCHQEPVADVQLFGSSLRPGSFQQRRAHDTTGARA